MSKLFFVRIGICFCSFFILSHQLKSVASIKNLLRPNIISQNNSSVNEGTIGGDNYGSLNNCGNGTTGGVVNCNFDRFYLEKENNGELAELCQSNNFGAIEPGVLFKTKKTYQLGEHIYIQYRGACPYKTDFLIIPANSPLSPMRNGGMRGRSIKVPSYSGEMTFTNKYLPKPSIPGTYAIQAYYIDEQGESYLGGRSLPFEIVGREVK